MATGHRDPRANAVPCSGSWVVVVRRGRPDGLFSNSHWDDDAPADVGTVIVRELAHSPFKIGRSNYACAIAIQDIDLNRTHFALELAEGSWFIHDAGSVLGVFVKGERVGRAPVVEGVVVSFGTSTLRLFDGHEAECRARAFAVSAESALRNRPPLAAVAERVLHEDVGREIARATAHGRHLTVFSVAGTCNMSSVTDAVVARWRNVARAIVRCEHDVVVVLNINATEAAVDVQGMSRKRSEPFAVGVAQFDCELYGERPDPASALVAVARQRRKENEMSIAAIVPGQK